LFGKSAINRLARKVGFIKRSSKLDALGFLDMLMFCHHQGYLQSLTDLACHLRSHMGINITKQGLQERFNEKAVGFMEKLLGTVMGTELREAQQQGLVSMFNRVRVKDSTKFSLPEAFNKVYKGFGGVVSKAKAIISIQFEYDLLSGKALGLKLTSGCRNDQTDSRESLGDVREGDLFIRDLGYVTLSYIKKIVSGKAFFLNRVPANTQLYLDKEGRKPLDFKKCAKKLKKKKLDCMEVAVFLGKKELVPCRLIVSAVDEKTYEKRLRKAQKHAKSKKVKVSDEHRDRIRLGLFITNVPQGWISTLQVQKVYSLRWQIELLFKVWKSQARIHQTKEMKIERFQCQLYAQLLWLLVNWKVFLGINGHVNAQTKGEKWASPWKFYKQVNRESSLLREIIINKKSPARWITELLDMAMPHFILEKKKGKSSFIDHINILVL